MKSGPIDNVEASALKFPKVSTKHGKGLNQVAKLVYEDNISFSKDVKSQALQNFYLKLGFEKVSYFSVNQALFDQYNLAVNSIKTFLNEQDKKDLLCTSFDKWTSADQKRFLGVYLYPGGKSICLGMVNFRGFCGGEETLAHLKHLLEVFDLCPSDIDICVVDCGADVQLTSRLANWYSFPCLCHIIYMIAKKLHFEETAYLRENDLESEPGFDEPSDIADLFDDMDDYVSVVKTAAAVCRKIHRSVRLQEKLPDAQKIKGLPQVSVVLKMLLAGTHF